MSDEFANGLNGHKYPLVDLDDYRDFVELKWEAVRRRIGYKKDFERCFEGKIIGSYASAGVDFKKKYGVWPAINPRLSFDDLWKRMNQKGDEEATEDGARISTALQTLMMEKFDWWTEDFRTDFGVILKATLNNTDISLKVFSDSKKLYKGRKSISSVPSIYKKQRNITFEINIDSKRTVLDKQIKEALNFWRGELQVVDGKSKSREKLKHGLSFRKQGLLIYDLYQQFPAQWDKIEKALPKSISKISRDRLRKHYEAAKEFINGGYRNLVS